MRLIATLEVEIDAAERAIAAHVLDDRRVRRLLTLPGVSLATAASLVAVIGDVGRFPRPPRLASYPDRLREAADRAVLAWRIANEKRTRIIRQTDLGVGNEANVGPHRELACRSRGSDPTGRLTPDPPKPAT